MSLQSVYESLADWCVECDDVYSHERDLPGWTEPTSCVDAGHHRAITGTDWEWVICDRCRGHGTLAGWPGAYTESDRAEWSDEDYEDYATTRRPCEDCGGTGKIRDLKDEARARPIVQEWLNDYYDDLRASEMERRMGA